MVELCTVDDVKNESLGRISDNSLDESIEYKIQDISEELSKLDPTLTRDDRDARMCCIYGVLAWLSSNQQINENKKVVSIKDGDVTVNYANDNSSSNENSDYIIYTSLKNKLTPFRPIVTRL